MFDLIKQLIPLRVKREIRDRFLIRDISIPLHTSPRAFVFLAADYGNIGDLAITAAQTHFLTKALPDHQVVPVPISVTRRVIHSIQREIMAEDLITIIGGGNMGSLYPEIEELRQLVVRSFPGNRVVCFPQSLDWNDTGRSRRSLKRIVRIYGNHPDLHLFARETISLHKMQELFADCPTVRVGLAPDIVLSTTAGDLGVDTVASRQGALLCLRMDRERHIGDQFRDAVAGVLGEAGLEHRCTDTHGGGTELTPALCASMIADKLTEFAAARLVVTDRLHGMILAVLAGTPCLALPNANHKIFQTWANWLSGVAYLRFLSQAEASDIAERVRELLAVMPDVARPPLVGSTVYEPLRAALGAK